ncbi:purine-cytosine permease family protein [Aquipuribacter nitratireducens]|uniref:Purine-cytosine permease family protein n=1 Tax=Aquipuribacter nitratireducens TaxID=650104 RepID=A0ABW0GST2_9MICO
MATPIDDPVPPAGPAAGPAAVRPRPRATEVEQFSVDTIPDADRTSGPFDLFRIQFGGANTFATVILGTLPVAFGLSFRDAVLATLLGVVVGAVILSPMGLFGPRTGTNNAVSSGAHFGTAGRVIGSFLSLLTATAFFSISVWVSGDALVGAAGRLLGVADSALLRAVLYGIIGALVVVVVVYGYQFMLLVNKVVVVGNSVLFLLGVVAFAGVFDAGYAGGEYLLGSFWPTFVLSALIVMGKPISFGAFLGDWSRYIPAATSKRSLLGATLLGQLATLVPFLFGVATATLVAGEVDYVVALVQVSPLWFVLPLVVVAFLGGMSTGITSLYGTGLDFSSVFPRFTRVQASLFIGSIAFVFILVGRLVVDLLGSVNAFIGAIIVCTTPWMVIMMIGFAVRRGHYLPRDLQVFNKGETGGAYRFHRGVNWRPVVAWVVAAVLGLQFAYFPPVIVGQWSSVVAGGVDVSLPVAIVTAAVLYLAALVVFPEPRYVFGPRGPWLVPCDERATEPPAIRPRADRSRTRRAPEPV